jgi:hypothetical protein
VHNRNKPGHTKKPYYVPQRVITSIPLYSEKLILQLLSIDDEDDEPVIVDEVKRDQKSLGKALRFLATGHLAPLDASSTTTFNTIDKFTVLYDLSINLDIEDLEQAVLGRIDNMDYDAVPLDVFMEFACSYYDDRSEESCLTPLGRLIKRKLSYLLPRLEQTITVDQLSREGGMLGMQLIAVLLEDRAKVRNKNRDRAGLARIKMEPEMTEEYFRDAMGG